MKHTIVTTTNESKDYIQFWPSMAKSWSNRGYNVALGFVTNRNENDPLVKELKKYGRVILYKPIPGIDAGNQAKVTRLHLATSYEKFTIADIDCYLLSHKVFKRWLSEYEPDKILAIGHNAYLGSDDEGKFPMIFTTGNGKVLSSIINPSNFNYNELLRSWIGLKIVDAKEDLSLPLYEFSDESLLRALIQRSGQNKIKKIARNDFVGMRAQRRIDRTNWQINKSKLKTGHYIDCCPHRPIQFKKLSAIFSHLNIDEPVELRKWK